MIEVNEAEKIILNHTLKVRIINLSLEKSIDRVLQEDIYADADFPPFDRVMMDGIAIDYSEYDKGRRKFKIDGMQAAGMPQQTLADKASCLEAMTGAILPEGCDTIIPYESLVVDEDKRWATVQEEDAQRGRNIHQKGIDKKEGDLLITSGRTISAAEIAIMASVGKTDVKVSRHPRIALISTGDELVAITQKPLPHQIRRSNIYALQAELNKMGLKCSSCHIKDEKEELRSGLSEILADHEVIILSGGVSMGKLDFIPEVLEECGVTKLFHKIRQKPGKPFWFGTRNGANVVFAFPGNPVSTFMCFHRYFKPWLSKSLGIENQTSGFAVLAEDFMAKTPLTYFLQVRTTCDKSGRLLAEPLVGRGSGDHANLLDADGFLELGSDAKLCKKGDVFPYYPYR